MNNLVEVKIENKNGELYVSSRDIANGLSKRHTDVMNQIKKIYNEQNENVRYAIIPSKYNDRGRELNEYLLTKDGFTLYMFNIQGYNEFKMAYINKFNEMEQALRNNVSQLSEMDRLKLELFSDDKVVVANAHKRIVELETKPLIDTIEEQKPLVEFASTVHEAGDAISIGEFAKMLKKEKGVKIGRNKLFQELRWHKVLDKKNLPYQNYLNKGWFKVVERAIKLDNEEDIKLYVQTLITGKGQVKLYDFLKAKDVI